MTRKLGTIAPDHNLANVQILVQGVEGAHCDQIQAFSGAPPPNTIVGDYSVAIDKALRTVPGANVLVNATFELEILTPSGTLSPYLCRLVEGDAGVLK